ncbi:uncharacterized protein [Salminus brasiliensis]|uniref:uncharacterized protein n=1 Tax=Salminus brasiliensis TaxID=930266 RepID=UPI003B834110
MSSTDVESLESRVARSRRMDMCLVGSVVVLFALVLSGFAAAALFAWNLNAGAESVHRSPQAIVSQQGSDDSPYKAKSFAYLRASVSSAGVMSKGVMAWEPIPYGEGQTMGSGYSYNPTQRMLTVKHEGSYFLYVQLNLSCIFQCSNEVLTITFEDHNRVEQLSCTMELLGNQTAVKKCWTVIPHLEKNSRLLAKIHSNKELKNRRLEVNSSGFGMFLVDGPEAD